MLLEKILGEDRSDPANPKFKILWQGYPTSTWESAATIEEADAWDLVETFREEWNRQHPREQRF